MSVDCFGKGCRCLQFGGIYSIRRVNDFSLQVKAAGRLPIQLPPEKQHSEARFYRAVSGIRSAPSITVAGSNFADDPAWFSRCAAVTPEPEVKT
jgi:hypothetical protein